MLFIPKQTLCSLLHHFSLGSKLNEYKTVFITEQDPPFPNSKVVKTSFSNSSYFSGVFL